MYQEKSHQRFVEQLDEEGHLGPVREICLVRAERTFNIRESIDTSPVIVQMILRGELIPHWYYRSDQWVDQPFFDPTSFVQPYVGPASHALPSLYGQGTYLIDEEMTEFVKKGGLKQLSS